MTLLNGILSIVGQIISGVVHLYESVEIAPGVNMWSFSLALILISAFVGVFFVIAKH